MMLAEVDFAINDSQGLAPIHWAIREGNGIEFFFQNDLTLEEKDFYQDRTPSMFAIVHASTSLLQSLAKKTIDNLSVDRDRSGQNLFHYVCHFGDVEKFNVIEPIMSEEAKRAQDNYGQTPFHFAVSEGNEIMASLKIANFIFKSKVISTILLYLMIQLTTVLWNDK